MAAVSVLVQLFRSGKEVPVFVRPFPFPSGRSRFVRPFPFSSGRSRFRQAVPVFVRSFPFSSGRSRFRQAVPVSVPCCFPRGDEKVLRC
ncbi:hypothetical protein DPMN_178042 [Dreissena polymorpha]|uniref:Uncharacterized protein n=1 Tax=Dreissena polymorpha TaxID=45954 RepID=A0A9D4E9V0_DREPO|nr:hypothetical protein DPMN_178028 [Dreissena polymorpha]KAH3776604.1 hypothetical protein DPMN_178035 [Dreissena polymorpha]KAH3776611.1 hypothetical protein DPMN_178042 [Dreissena polymorpha]